MTELPNPTNRKAFQDLPPNQNAECADDGFVLYMKMREKHGCGNVESLDKILNGMCAGLIYLIRDNVNKDHYGPIIQLVHKVLTKNLIERNVCDERKDN